MVFEDSLPTFDVRADFWSLRFVDEYCETYAVRKNVPMPFVACTDQGVLATACVDGGYVYLALFECAAVGTYNLATGIASR